MGGFFSKLISSFHENNNYIKNVAANKNTISSSDIDLMKTMHSDRIKNLNMSKEDIAKKYGEEAVKTPSILRGLAAGLFDTGRLGWTGSINTIAGAGIGAASVFGYSELSGQTPDYAVGTGIGAGAGAIVGLGKHVSRSYSDIGRQVQGQYRRAVHKLSR